MITIHRKYYLFMLLAILTSCKKFLEVAPPNDKLETSSVFADSTSAAHAIIAIYSQLTSGNLGLLGQKSITAGLAADELYFTGNNDSYTNFQDNNLQINNSQLNDIWTDLYAQIYRANAAYEGVNSSSGIIPSAKAKLKAEALFIRAFCYFYLVNYWGDVPLITSTAYQSNAIKGRSAVTEVYAQIISDLVTAQADLPEDYPTADRGRPNKWAAAALLARTYLYTKDYTNASIIATNIINQSGMYNLADLNLVFKKESSETIWQIVPVTGYTNSWDATIFIPYPDQVPTFALRDSLVHSFESADKRKSSWINSTTVNNSTYSYPYKYQVQQASDITECDIIFRLGEIYLIRAEANIAAGKLADGEADINTIRSRAGLAGINIGSKEDGLQALETERIHELFAEWGNRWLDLKRWNTADQVLPAIKGNNWQSTDVLWPIPAQQILLNKSLSQNNGYF
ncbi:RagB/SusD family nutrient uptake outer membrane protein [Chitinophaga silvisoli]|uniref:RagB/SusD family nutrient uptake outer membrane protein n=1 Tax=Chitinophaga silvisoli TaxID=2291814 RepID=A0A3E1P3I1_9BACT|nr:RagB/SusD family nutrient uptake outer membrane protein [Chitinophaga silvisoli]RFM34680.1 RagB/SusD family nutrient uptake outer membrane protein [Chitinophaga silvisoli]